MMNHLITVYEDRTINVTSRVFKRKNAPPPDIIGTNLLTNPPPLGVHVFQPTGTVFKLIKDIIGTNLLIKFHEDLTINVASRKKCTANWLPWTNIQTKFHDDLKIIEKCPPPSGGHVFQPTGIIF
ncbi:hypothetical protein DPMN_172988 [Dreissena polymorpha]|uniref:Uncharacterized protein n=1 Tax=Dreissena polymorpha TaxID=45954 RepID=A0A9D4E1U8_DREPO|nr:hypothetical protein DPMN_172988 [Dreissena polymorpha]